MPAQQTVVGDKTVFLQMFVTVPCAPEYLLYSVKFSRGNLANLAGQRKTAKISPVKLSQYVKYYKRLYVHVYAMPSFVNVSEHHLPHTICNSKFRFQTKFGKIAKTLPLENFMLYGISSNVIPHTH